MEHNVFLTNKEEIILENKIPESKKSEFKFIVYLIENGINNINFSELVEVTKATKEELELWLSKLKSAEFFNEDGSVKINGIYKEASPDFEKLNFEIESAMLIAEGKITGKFREKPTYVLTSEKENKDVLIFNGEWFKIMKSNIDNSLYIAKADSVVILPFINNNTILFERQHRAAINKHLFEIPAGSIKTYDYENKEEAVNKILLAETGYIAKKIYPMFQSFASPGIYNTMHNFYVARELEKMEHSIDNKIEIMKINFNNALNYIKTGEIQDNKTSLAILFYNTFMK